MQYIPHFIDYWPHQDISGHMHGYALLCMVIHGGYHHGYTRLYMGLIKSKKMRNFHNQKKYAR